MYVLSIAFPFDGVMPIASTVIGAAAGAARPLIGLGLFATLVVLFRPLISGLIRAALLMISPRLSLEDRRGRARMKSHMRVNRMARELQDQHPSLAAEMLSISARD